MSITKTFITIILKNHLHKINPMTTVIRIPYKQANYFLHLQWKPNSLYD